MRTPIQILDEAIEIAKQECTALSQDDLEKAESLGARRSQLLIEAWNMREQCDAHIYKAKLLQLKSVQAFLTDQATKKQQEVRQGLLRSRKENKRMASYKKQASYGA